MVKKLNCYCLLYNKLILIFYEGVILNILYVFDWGINGCIFWLLYIVWGFFLL